MAYGKRKFKRTSVRRYRRKLGVGSFTTRYRSNVRNNVLRSRASSAIARHMHHRWGTPLNTTTYNSVTGCTFSNTTGILTVNGSVVQCGSAHAFTLNDMPDVSEFTSLYDQYKLCGVLFTIKMINNPNSTWVLQNSVSSVQNFYPTIWYAPDHDDIAAPTIQILKEYSRSRHKVLTPNREIKIFLRPTTLQQLYDGVASTAYAVNYRKPWLDMVNPEVPHYGLKYAIDFEGLTLPAATAGQYQFKINTKYYFCCQNAR